jgi:hypothetical protein
MNASNGKIADINETAEAPQKEPVNVREDLVRVQNQSG